MKKIKILLPIASVAALAGTVTPLMTSCGTTTTTDGVIPTDSLLIEDVTLMGLKAGVKVDQSWTTLSIPEGVKLVNKEAFKDVFKDKTTCKVTKVVFPKTLVGIGSSAFEGCDTINSLDFSALDDVTNIYQLKLGSAILDENAANRFGNVVLSSSTEAANNRLTSRLIAAGVPEPWLYGESSNKISLANKAVTAYNAVATFNIELKDSLPTGGKVKGIINITDGTENATVTLEDAIVEETNGTQTATMKAKISSTTADALKDGDYVKMNIQFLGYDEYGIFAWKQTVSDCTVTYMWQEVSATSLVVSGETTLSAGSAKTTYTAALPDPIHERLYSSITWSLQQTVEGGASINETTGELSINNINADNTVTIKATAKNKDGQDIYGTLNVSIISTKMMITFDSDDTFVVDAETDFFDECTFSYSSNGKDWTVIQDTNGIPVTAGQTLYLKGRPNDPTASICYGGQYSLHFYNQNSTKYSVSGSITSLADDGGDPSLTPTYGIQAFQGLFSGEGNGLKSVSKNFLSAIKAVPYSGFYQMFYQCDTLESAPDILATSLGQGACDQMFQECTSLTTLPTLATTNLSANCYQNMFSGCKGLKTISDDYTLPAKYVPTYGYYRMFSGCTGLTKLPKNFISATSMSYEACYGMFASCTSLETAMEQLSAMPTSSNGAQIYQYMFRDCTSLTTAPIITLQSSNDTYDTFNGMFMNCEQLAYVSLPNWSDYIGWNCFNSWLYGTARSGIIYAPNCDGYNTSTNIIPDGWTVVQQ